MTEWTQDGQLLGAGIARRWVAFYTAGLPQETRARRIAEIESDVWEHQRERLAEGRSDGETGLEILGRTVRGIAADVLWRFQLEGPKMEVRIPLERIAGGLLVALVVLMVISSGISGYDTSREGWADELRRFGSQSDATIRFNIAGQIVVGLLLIVASVGFAVALRQRAGTPSLFAAAFLAAAGVLVIGASAAYRVTADFANDFAAGTVGDEVLIPSRTAALLMDSLVNGVIAALMLGLFTLAFAVHKNSLVPRWMSAFIGLAVVAFVFGMGAVVFQDGDGLPWASIMIAFLASVLWLLLAGFTLLLGWRREAPPATALKPAQGAT